MGIVLMAMSGFSIFVRLPFGEKFALEYFNIQFWTYTIASIFNLYAGYRLFKRERKAETFAIIVVASTFVVLQVMLRILVPDYGFGYTLFAMVIPAILIYMISMSRSQPKSRK